MSVGFYFDMTRCTGCRTCQISCKDKNRLDVGTIYRNAKTYSVGLFPSLSAYSFSASCNHCGMPACIAACTADAIYRAKDGTVIISQEHCVFDGACITACPYEVPQITAGGAAGKCDGCYAIREAGSETACVASCPNRALLFGEYEDLKATFGADSVSEIALLPPANKTAPSLLIKAKDAAKDFGYIEINW